MAVTDPVGNMVASIKNAIQRKKETVDIPLSKLKEEIARIMKEEGYIVNYKSVTDEKQGILRIYLKYTAKRVSAIKDLKEISKPGRRVYKKASRIPRVYGGLGIGIISTSSGLMTDEAARKARTGGEVICYIW